MVLSSGLLFSEIDGFPYLIVPPEIGRALSDPQQKPDGHV